MINCPFQKANRFLQQMIIVESFITLPTTLSPNALFRFLLWDAHEWRDRCWGQKLSVKALLSGQKKLTAVVPRSMHFQMLYETSTQCEMSCDPTSEQNICCHVSGKRAPSDCVCFYRQQRLAPNSRMSLSIMETIERICLKWRKKFQRFYHWFSWIHSRHIAKLIHPLLLSKCTLLYLGFIDSVSDLWWNAISAT